MTLHAASTHEIEHLAQQANSGDREAGARFIAECMPYWMSRARGIVHARHSADAEDLVQNAVMKLIALWKAGDGPATHTRAYVVAAIRNAYIDRLRSPSSTAVSLDVLSETGAEPADEHGDFSDDLMLEQDAVRKAFAALGEPHQTVLNEVLIQGAKPAELVGRLRRSAPAISNLLNRAKLELRRRLLIEYLSNGGRECSENAGRVPKRVSNDPTMHNGDDPAIRHVHSCAVCRRNWRSFAVVGTMLGVLPLFTLAAFRGGSALMHGAGGTAASVAAAGEGARAESLGFESPSAGMQSVEAQRPDSSRLPQLATLLAGGALIAATGIALVVADVLLPDQATEQPATPTSTQQHASDMSAENPPGVMFDVTSHTLRSVGRTATREFSADFALADPDAWTLDELRLNLSSSSEWEHIPEGLECVTGLREVVCSGSALTQHTAPFTFRVTTGTQGSFVLNVVAVSDGQRVEASAEGHWG